jgi:hypothetical protein
LSVAGRLVTTAAQRRQPLLVDSYGTEGFATIAGVMTVPLTITKAVAPLAAAALHNLSTGYTAMAAIAGAACMTAAVLVLIEGAPSVLAPSAAWSRSRADQAVVSVTRVLLTEQGSAVGRVCGLGVRRGR